MPSLGVPAYVQTEERALVRETRSGALLNTDRPALTRHRTMRTRATEQTRNTQEVRDLRHLVGTLESRIAELTGLVESAVTALKR